jgi:hypothetical protein
MRQRRTPTSTTVSQPSGGTIQQPTFGNWNEGNRIHVVELMPAQGWRLVRAAEAAIKFMDTGPDLEEIGRFVDDAELDQLVEVKAVAAFALIEHEYRYYGTKERAASAKIHIRQDIRPVAASFVDSAGLDVVGEWGYLALLGPGELLADHLRSLVAAHIHSAIDLDVDDEERLTWLKEIYARHGAVWPWDE